MPAILPSPDRPDDGQVETLAARLESARRMHAYAAAADFGTASTGELLYLLVSLRDELGALLDAVEADVDETDGLVVDVDELVYVVAPRVRVHSDALAAAVDGARGDHDQAAAVDVGTVSRAELVSVWGRLHDSLNALLDQVGRSAEAGNTWPGMLAAVAVALPTLDQVAATDVAALSREGLAYQIGLLVGTLRGFLDAVGGTA
ncbi:hypothetical protein LO772_19410 [Yinghuangia sp. ASG 101]|uniref:hypothetical protein n=1 Tax=Yinghuangia sp. ASG 101 TaxID=2896848 RepID=UPI001E4B4A79|nr:hypothetical protein [Yinghuangia sp. ASG 101]UGQ09126.1 hypothetical protein LO772_19410 [Yinghuangia sp. ASG 101]